VNESILYRGGYDIVQAFDTRDGKLLWETTLPRAGNTVYIFYLSDQIFIHTSSGRSFTVDVNGQLMNSTDPNFTKITLVSDNVVYINKFDQIEAIDTITGETKWHTALGDYFLYGPIFSDDMIYIRTKGATIPGVIYALDQNNGQVVWKTRGNVISNFCILDSSLFYLTVEGYLIGVDQKTGEQTKALEFSPRPFILPDPGIMVGGYYVATDPVNHTIAVSLGDSLQLFAIKINK
jgi:outer membrane protein assembly factor BamB